jgi:hypothetical protein
MKSETRTRQVQLKIKRRRLDRLLLRPVQSGARLAVKVSAMRKSTETRISRQQHLPALPLSLRQVASS